MWAWETAHAFLGPQIRPLTFPYGPLLYLPVLFSLVKLKSPRKGSSLLLILPLP